MYWASQVAQFSSVQFSHSVVSGCLPPHEMKHARPPCPSPTPGVYQNSCSLSRWCHPTISSSVVPFSSCPQSFPVSAFPMSQLFTWGGHSIGVSASTSVLPKNTQDWSPLGWTSWISLQSKGLSRVFSNTTVQKHQFCQCRRYKRCGIDPWVGKMPWRREWQPTSVFLPRKFHRQRSLEGYSPWGCKDSDTTEHEHDVLYSLKGQISAAPFYLDKAKCGYLQRKDWLKIGWK